jgi:hypothetical protein
LGEGRVSLVLVLGLLPLLPGPCGGDSSEGQRLIGSANSLDELATEVLAGLASADTSRLNAVRLTEYEHNELVYPELPAARPENNHPAALAWSNIQVRNSASLIDLFSEFDGHELEYVGAECRGPTRAFESFVVHTDCFVTMRIDRSTERTVQLFKDVLDRDGELKIFRYYEP